MSDRIKKLPPLKWKSHSLSRSSAMSLRSITDSARAKLSHFAVNALAQNAPAQLAASMNVWLPELPDEKSASLVGREIAEPFD